jgi:polyphenol oxidase
MAFAVGWITPDWPAPVHVRAVCTTRQGGVSQAPYDTCNLGDHVGDSPQAVAANRARLAQAIGARPVYLRQVHGREVVRLDADTADGVQADACVTTARGLACTIMVADCLPLLFTTDDGRIVAAAHAGWRGLAGVDGQGVVEAIWSRLRTAAGEQTVQPSEVMVWLGPCIGPDAFEVGPEVKAAFTEHDPQAASLFRPHGSGKWVADLPGLTRRKLRDLGLTRVYGNDGTREWCTVSNASTFFSHRRDRVSGRFAASIWRA